ncbi:hypothetical protein [Pseudomonas sp.]|jgi:hypothetical protein|uniref:hypothetical protein n=1 Tax=Pseudomonas sp. TaxID=306 RepID=UPI002ED88000
MSRTPSTPTPWEYNHASHGDARGQVVVTEYFVRQVGANVAIASDIIDPETGLPSEANAKRIAAAMNACEGIDTSGLVGLGGLGLLAKANHNAYVVKHQRDALFKALQSIILHANPVLFSAGQLQQAQKALAMPQQSDMPA